MSRKISLLLTVFMFSSVFVAWGQNKMTDEQKRKSWEEFRAKRVAFIAQQIGLTTEEADAFWPVCNELQEKKFALNRAVRRDMRSAREAERAKKAISEAEYDRLINQNVDLKAKEAELDREYIKKFRKILSAEKVFKYQQAEQRFTREFLPPNNVGK